MLFSALIAPLLAVGAAAQTWGAYTEPKSGIQLQAATIADPGYTFGLALPENPTTDFIGHIAGKGKGWVGVSLGGAMTNTLLITAWPNGNNVLSSFRSTTQYSSPAVATGPWSLKPIASGTYVNSTHFSLTFVCSKCITNDSKTFNATSDTGVFGWAYNAAAPPQPSSASTSFNRHSTQGIFGGGLIAARTSKYAQWAALANGTL